MQFSELFSAERIIRQTLDWLETAMTSSIANRVSDEWVNGVDQGALNNMAIVGKDLDPSLPDFFHVKIDTGVAYVNGERVYISVSNNTTPFDTSVGQVNSINHTTDDGFGNPILTPRSTGSWSIPLSATFINYLYIAYLQTTDDSQFTLHKLTRAKQFYKRTDGYQIVVNTTGTNPDPTNYIFLGQVDLTGSNTAISPNISIVNRDLHKTRIHRVGIETVNALRTDRPAVYTDGQQQYFLDDHIKAVGSGTVTPFNPHGMTAADIGITTNETVQAHRQIEHTNGIVAGTPGTPSPTSSGLNVVRVVVSPGDDYVIVKALALGEFAVCNGLAFDQSDIPADTTLIFTGQPAGTYNVYFDSTNKTIAYTTASIGADKTKLWLATTTWDTSIPGDGNLSIPFDHRQFGTLNPAQRWVTSGRPPFPLPGVIGFNMDTLHMEYWNGSSWVTVSP